MKAAAVQHFEVERYPANGEAIPDSAFVTFLCADVVSFTEMTDRLGDVHALEVMRQLAHIVRDHATTARARVLEIRGDSFLLSFADACSALACALLLQRTSRSPLVRDERISLRMAIHCGQVLMDGDGYFGRAAIIPHRVLAQVAANEIAITSDAADRLPAGLLHADHWTRGFEPKGLVDAVDYLVVDTGGRRRDVPLELVDARASVH